MQTPAGLFDPGGTSAAGDAAEWSGSGRDLVHLMAGMPGRLRGRPLPKVVAVTVSHQSIGLLLGEPRLDPAAGFDAIDGGLTWMIERSSLAIPEALPAGNVPWPLLVPLGRLCPNGLLVLVNLEEFGAVEAIGEPADVLALAEFLAAEIAADHFGGHSRVICVNFEPQLPDLDGIRVVRSPREAQADVEAEWAGVRSADEGRAALPELRVRGSSGLAAPLVIIDPRERDPALRRRLRALAGPGLAVVTAGSAHDPATGDPGRPAHDRGWAFEVMGQRLTWEPVGVDLRFGHAAACPPPPGESRRDAARPPAVTPVRSGIRDARSPDGQARSTPGSAPCSGGYGWVGEPPGAHQYADIADVTAGKVELQVLGVVQAVGVSAPFTSQRALDLACYLAFHRDGASADRLRYWLWRRSEPLPSRKAFANVVSRARVCLGRGPGGEPYLSRVSAEGVYRLSAEVTTDLERFTAWQGLAERLPPQQGLECLRAALWLVRGVPFGGGSGGTFSWADASWRSHVEYLVDSTAHWLADMALDLGRDDVARWATLRGLAVTPDCEQCFQRRITAARRSGRRQEADRVMRDMARLERDPVLSLDDIAYAAL